ncbi:MAG: ABC transporter ATP-binding protein [Pseudomonadota bacterium]
MTTPPNAVVGTAVSARALGFGYQPATPVLDIESLDIERGDKVFVEGPSGSGKSTLLGLIGGILTRTNGALTVLGTELADLSAAKRDRFRSDNVGFVFQMFNLLPYLSLLDNVLLPCRFSRVRAERAGDSAVARRTEAERLLGRLGLAPELARRRVTELSIGQQQRVAVARALIGQPPLLIADEPTSALDARTRMKFVELVVEECDRHGTTLVFVSHDPQLANSFDRTLSLPAINRVADLVDV